MGRHTTLTTRYESSSTVRLAVRCFAIACEPVNGLFQGQCGGAQTVCLTKAHKRDGVFLLPLSGGRSLADLGILHYLNNTQMEAHKE